ncbi:MAG: Abi family protein [Bacteroides intestinalis]|nr:Abi family protein [Bacteroides intestinalis]
MSGYWYPLLADKQKHQFKPESTFDAAYNIYKFDSELRKLIITELEKIEVAVRTQTAYILSSQWGGYWFTDASRFSNPTRHTHILSKIDEEYQRSDEEFVTAFRSKYSDSFPPSWITMEITSFGTLSILYNNLLPGRAKRSIASYFGLPDTVFASWLHSIVYIRNICAHHCRLWNRTLSIRPLMPRSPHQPFIALPASGTRQVYFLLSMIVYLLDIINPNHSFVERFKRLLSMYPSIDIRAMGFPANWADEDTWK